jgi:hypothetical protein
LEDFSGNYPEKIDFFLKFSREFPEKSSKGHTDFIFEIEPSKRVEILCKRRKNLKIRYLIEVSAGF